MDYVVNSKGTKLIDVIYPVGSIYMSFNSTSPATLFGGTWVQITDRFLYCANSSGTTGGENSHTLTVSEMPSHNHVLRRQRWFGADVAESDFTGAIFSWVDGEPSLTYKAIASTNMGYTGGSQPHNNMPQYITCYAWHRTA